MVDLSLLDPERLEAVLLEVERLLVGQTEERDGQKGNFGYRSTEGFTALNQLICEVATSAAIQQTWDDEKTWETIEQLLLEVADDDYDQPQLLAAKILMGLRTAPGWDEFVPMPNMKQKSRLITVESLRNGPESTVTFENSITLRRRYAAPLLVPGADSASTLRVNKRKDRRNPNHLERVARRLLEALLDRVVESTGGAFSLSSSPEGGATQHESEEFATPPVDGTGSGNEAEPNVVALMERASESELALVETYLGIDEKGQQLGEQLPDGERKRRSKLGWITVSVALLAVLGVSVGIFLSNQSSDLYTVPMSEQDWIDMAASTAETGVESAESAPWRLSEMLETIKMEHCEEVADSSNRQEGQEFLKAWNWQGESCLTTSLLIDPDEPIGLWFVYQNHTEERMDDVTVWAELPAGFEIEENSTYFLNSSSRNGNLAINSLDSSGINLGSYGTNANVVVGARIKVVDSELACAGRGSEVRTYAISNAGRDRQDAPQVATTYLTCERNR